MGYNLPVFIYRKSCHIIIITVIWRENTNSIQSNLMKEAREERDSNLEGNRQVPAS